MAFRMEENDSLIYQTNVGQLGDKIIPISMPIEGNIPVPKVYPTTQEATKKIDLIEAAKIYINLGQGDIQGGLDEFARSQAETPMEELIVEDILKKTDWGEEVPEGANIGRSGTYIYETVDRSVKNITEAMKLPDFGEIGKWLLLGGVAIAGLYVAGKFIGRGKK